jgi:hypothetical protein
MAKKEIFGAVHVNNVLCGWLDALLPLSLFSSVLMHICAVYANRKGAGGGGQPRLAPSSLFFFFVCICVTTRPRLLLILICMCANDCGLWSSDGMWGVRIVSRQRQ